MSHHIMEIFVDCLTFSKIFVIFVIVLRFIMSPILLLYVVIITIIIITMVQVITLCRLPTLVVWTMGQLLM